MPIDRETLGTYLAASWTEVIRHAREELKSNSPAATAKERAMLGYPVLIECTEADGSVGGGIGVLARIEVDHESRWAVFDYGLGVDTKSPGFTMRPLTASELEEYMAP